MLNQFFITGRNCHSTPAAYRRTSGSSLDGAKLIKYNFYTYKNNKYYLLLCSLRFKFFFLPELLFFNYMHL